MPCFEVSYLWSLSSSIYLTLATLPHFNTEYATDPFNFLEPHRSHDSIPLQVLKGRNRTGTRVDEDIITATQNCYRKHGNTFYFTIGKTVRLSIADPQLIKAILIANSNSYAKPQHVRVLGILGTGIFASSAEIWAPQRQLLNGAFHTKEVKVCRLYMLIPPVLVSTVYYRLRLIFAQYSLTWIIILASRCL